MREIVLVAHNIRSTYNVGSLLRTADGLGMSKVIFSGFTPYPIQNNDPRLPHIASKMATQIHKTALGAENSVDWETSNKLPVLLKNYQRTGYEIVALEQTPKAIDLNNYVPATKIVLIVGSEVGGIDKDTLELATTHLRIPMKGSKESFNVSVAAAVALYHLLYLV
jgi:23S rRNA (guanosine2251-2'-O)-methyltransferase